MKQRNRSFIWITILYILAIGLGIFIFTQVNGSLIFKLFIADVSATLFIWIFSLILKNASLYDPYWSVIPPVLLILVMIYLNNQLSLSIFLMLTAITLWSVRLTYNWAKNWQGFREVDWRYLKIRDASPKLYPLTNLFGIQLMPTTIVFLQLILAVKVIEANPFIHPLIILGSLVIAMGAMIQFVADQQMRKHRQLNSDQKRIIDFGLWKYSRHPNYFGELSVWWGLYVIYLGSFQVLDVYILAPILMTMLFLFISIPLMEKKIIASRPEYQNYQKEVSMLIPFFRKHSK